MNQLHIYVTAGCSSCRRAREIASSLEGAYPGIRVEVVETETIPDESLPESVVAVPAYVLNGPLVSLGYPKLATIREQLAALVLRSG